MIRALVLATLLAVPSSARPERPTPPAAPPRVVTIDPIVRDLLAALWDDSTATQPERAYCVAYVVTRAWGVPAYRVWAIAPAVTIDADPYHVTADCPRGPNIALVHVHVPTTCDEATHMCALGGPDAWECEPSETDERVLHSSGAPFGLLQCDRHALTAYFRSHP